MRPTLLAVMLAIGCVDALPADDRLDAGSAYLRLLRPRAGATVFARRPRLRWHRADATVDSRVELCADRECTRPLQRLDVTGATTQVPVALPTGVVFWRVRPRRGAVVAPWGSPTGWFVVARGAHDDDRADSIDARPRLQIDVDGDGRADVVLPDGTIYRSEDDGFEAAPYGRLLDANGAGAVTAGDLNGDGFLDLAVADASGRPGGVLHVYDGPLARGVAAPRRQLTGPDGVDWTFPSAATWADAPVGDVNGDGYDDLFVAAQRTDGRGRVHVFLGGPSGVAYTPAQTFESPLPAPSDFGAQALADLDGDGFDEALLVSEARANFRPVFVAPRVFVHRGSSTGLESLAGWVFQTESSSPTGAGGFGDTDGAGTATAVLRRSGTVGGRCLGLFRDPFGRDDRTVGDALGCDEGQRDIGRFLEVGDVDGDGRADVVASVHAEGDFAAATMGLRVYRAPTAAGAAWRVTTLASEPGATEGAGRFGLGDVDGDGVMDAIRWVPTTSGPTAWVHRGGAEGVAPMGQRVGR